MHKVSLIITVLNEEKTITALLESVVSQTQKPTELIVVDGGSTDATVKIISDFFADYNLKLRNSKQRTQNKKENKIDLILKTKQGNRSIGRNYAVSLTTTPLIAITDAGCVLDDNWLKELLKKKSQTKALVISGYYDGLYTTKFQEAIIPYVLVMPDKINEDSFLPATRSMLIEKKLFMKLGGFNEKFNDNEDYVFAKKIEKEKVKIAFAKNAVVHWIPRKTLREFYRMVFRFARGDMYAKIIRPKVLLIFARYILLLSLFILSLFLQKISEFTVISLVGLLLYSLWAMRKNKKYVPTGYVYLPILQISSDLAVMHGSIIGFLKAFL